MIKEEGDRIETRTGIAPCDEQKQTYYNIG